jgi:hypothetical protein
MTSMTFSIFQGEHMLAELNECIGSARLDGIPPLPRWQASVACTVEYSDDGILIFSAREARSGKSVKATFTAKTEFTAADRVRLQQGSQMSKESEGITADRRYLRSYIVMDLRRAESQLGNPQFQAAARKWREWLRNHEEADPAVFREKCVESQAEFQAIDPKFWGSTRQIPRNIGFRSIWPVEPSFTQEGAAIIRFSTPADYQRASATLEHMGTRKLTTQDASCRTLAAGRIETFMRIAFPENGKYKVSLSIMTAAGEWTSARERAHTELVWLFDVSGTPAAARSIWELMSGNVFLPLPRLDILRIDPESSCIRIPGLVYEFTCTFRGKLVITGREPPGQETQVFTARVTDVPCSSGWRSQQCRLEYPSSGTWRVMFSIDYNIVATQTVVTGFRDSRPLTAEERMAFAAVAK